jgi:hypothetical protein
MNEPGFPNWGVDTEEASQTCLLGELELYESADYGECQRTNAAATAYAVGFVARKNALKRREQSVHRNG